MRISDAGRSPSVDRYSITIQVIRVTHSLRPLRTPRQTHGQSCSMPHSLVAADRRCRPHTKVQGTGGAPARRDQMSVVGSRLTHSEQEQRTSAPLAKTPTGMSRAIHGTSTAGTASRGFFQYITTDCRLEICRSGYISTFQP